MQNYFSIFSKKVVSYFILLIQMTTKISINKTKQIPTYRYCQVCPQTWACESSRKNHSECDRALEKSYPFYKLEIFNK